MSDIIQCWYICVSILLGFKVSSVDYKALKYRAMPSVCSYHTALYSRVRVQKQMLIVFL